MTRTFTLALLLFGACVGGDKDPSTEPGDDDDVTTDDPGDDDDTFTGDDDDTNEHDPVGVWQITSVLNPKGYDTTTTTYGTNQVVTTTKGSRADRPHGWRSSRMAPGATSPPTPPAPRPPTTATPTTRGPCCRMA